MPISINQKKLINKLTQKKYRQQLKKCVVSGQKNLSAATGLVDFLFTKNDIADYKKIVGANEPQVQAAVVRLPKWTETDVKGKKTIVVADGVQDPGNVGTIIRLCAAFSASIILIESADPTDVKTIRASAGAIFFTPWLELSRSKAENFIKSLKRAILRLENKNTSLFCNTLNKDKIIGYDNGIILIVGSEGHGIKLKISGQSLTIKTSPIVESLNVATASAIALHELRYLSLA